VAARRLTFQVLVTWFFMVSTPTWQYSQVQVSEEPLICSARGCRNPAVHALRWNNPKLHTPDRRKTWLACDAHLTSLGDFLRARQFLREVEPLAAE
jgi:hypothetical protein